LGEHSDRSPCFDWRIGLEYQIFVSATTRITTRNTGFQRALWRAAKFVLWDEAVENKSVEVIGFLCTQW
jgi:hypothetical protein